MEWRNKISALIRQTELNLSLVDGRPVTTPSSPPATPNQPRGNNDSSSSIGYKSGLQTLPFLQDEGTKSGVRETFDFSSSPSLSSLYNGFTKAPDDEILMELKLLKQQFLLFKENSEKTAKAQKTVISSQLVQIEDLKQELMMQAKAEDDLAARIKADLTSHLTDHITDHLSSHITTRVRELIAPLHARINSLETRVGVEPLTGADGTQATAGVMLSRGGESPAPLQGRLEQLQATLHSTTSHLRHDLADVNSSTTRLRQDLTTLSASDNQLRHDLATLSAVVESLRARPIHPTSLAPSVVPSMTPSMASTVVEVGGLRSMASGWNASIGNLKHELEVLKAAVDRVTYNNNVSNVRTELHNLREQVERNSGWQAVVGALRHDVDSLRNMVQSNLSWAESNLRNEPGFQDTTNNYSRLGTQNEFSPYPDQEYATKHARSHKLDLHENYNTDKHSKIKYNATPSSTSDSNSDSNKRNKRRNPTPTKNKYKKDKQRPSTADKRPRSRQAYNYDSTSDEKQDDDEINPNMEPEYPPSKHNIRTPTTPPWKVNEDVKYREELPVIRPLVAEPRISSIQSPKINPSNINQEPSNFPQNTPAPNSNSDVDKIAPLPTIRKEDSNSKPLEVPNITLKTESDGELPNTGYLKSPIERQDMDYLVYDKTDTENTELIYDRTDTDVQASEVVFDATDTDATLETDLSFFNDNSNRMKTIYTSGSDTSVLKPLKGLRHSSESNSSQSPDFKRIASKNPATRKQDSPVTEGRELEMKGGSAKNNRIGYETDEIGKTEDDFSLASFAEDSYKSMRSSVAGESALRKSNLSLGLDSDAMGKTEDDFSSLASFSGGEEDIQEDIQEDTQEDEYSNDEGNSSSSSYITAEPTPDPTLEELPRNRLHARDDDASDTSVRRSNKLFSRFLSKKAKKLNFDKLDTQKDEVSSSSDSDSSLMGSWDRMMGPSSITLPSSLLKASRNSPISARKMYSDDEEEQTETASNALAKTGSFMTYEQFSKQFVEEGTKFIALSPSILTLVDEPKGKDMDYANPREEEATVPVTHHSSRSSRLASPFDAPESNDEVDSNGSDDNANQSDVGDDYLAPSPLNLDIEDENLNPPRAYSSQSVSSVESSEEEPTRRYESTEAHTPSSSLRTESPVGHPNEPATKTSAMSATPSLSLVSNENSIALQSANSNPPRKYKRSVSNKILDLQKECGFFRRPPPSLSPVVVAPSSNLPSLSPTEFVHSPIASPTRSRPRGPPRRPPTPTRR